MRSVVICFPKEAHLRAINPKPDAFLPMFSTAWHTDVMNISFVLIAAFADILQVDYYIE